MKKDLIIFLGFFLVHPLAIICAQEKLMSQRELNDELLLLVQSRSSTQEEVQELIAQGADAHVCTREGESALFLAANEGNTAVCQALLAHGALVNEQVAEGTFKGCSPLMAAACTNNCQLLELLIKRGARGELVNHLGNTALLVAVYDGHYDACRTLLEAPEFNADKNRVNRKGETALTVALTRNDKQIGRLLIAHGIDLHAPAKRPDHQPPLFKAARYRAYEWIPLLVEAGALVNFGDARGITCLMVLAEKGAYDWCTYLLQHGARATILNDKGYDAAAYAVNAGNDAILQLLIEYQAPLQRVYPQGRALLHIAAIRGQRATVSALLNLKANAHFKDFRGKTPLHYAAANGDSRVCRLLLDAYAQPGMFDNEEKTPLMLAIKEDHPEVCELLLWAHKERGSTHKGRAPLILAILAGSPGACKYLVKRTRGIFVRMTYSYRNTYYDEVPFKEAVYQGNVAVCRVLIATCMFIPHKSNARSVMGRVWDRLLNTRDPQKVITMLLWCAKKTGIPFDVLSKIIAYSEELQDFLLIVLVPRLRALKKFPSSLVPLITPAIVRCTIKQLQTHIAEYEETLRSYCTDEIRTLLNTDSLEDTFKDDITKNIVARLYETLAAGQ